MTRADAPGARPPRPASAEADAPAPRLATSEPDRRARGRIDRLGDASTHPEAPPVSAAAVRDLARSTCGDPDGIRSLLAEVPVLDVDDATQPRALAVIVALGRCESEDALRGLISLYEAGSLSVEARRTVFLALAQARDPDASMRPGKPAMGMGMHHVQITGPVAEPFVREALLRWFRAADVHERSHFAAALGASASVDREIRAEVLAIRDDERLGSSRNQQFLHAITLAAHEDLDLAMAALEVAKRPASDDEVRVAVMTATSNPRAEPLEAVLAYVSDSATGDDRRRMAYAGIHPAFGRDERASAAVLALVRSAAEWAAHHPTYEVSERLDMREGAPPTITKESTHVALAPAFQCAYATAKDAPAVRETVVRFLLRGLETAQPKQLLYAFHGHAPDLGRDVTAALAGQRPPLVVLETLATFFAENDGAPRVFAAIRASGERLPSAEREALEARLRALGR